MAKMQIYEYKGTQIEFEIINGEIYANGTKMCSAFGREVRMWTRLDSTQQYIAELRNCAEYAQLNFVEIREGRNGGTWIHEKVILKLAQWLDVKFEIWCNGKIAELLKNGNTAIKPMSIEEMIIATAQGMIETKKRVSLLEIDNEVSKEEIIITNARVGVVENKVTDILMEKEIALDELKYLETSNEELPEESLRSKIVKIVNSYSRAKNIQQQEIWKKIYTELYYRYKVSLNAYKKQSKNENLLDVAERNNHLGKIFTIASNLFVKKEIQLA